MKSKFVKGLVKLFKVANLSASRKYYQPNFKKLFKNRNMDSLCDYSNMDIDKKKELEKEFEKKFPYECKIKESGTVFVPTMIDFDNEQVWRQRAQTSECGEWYSFEEVEFIRSPEITINNIINKK